MGMLKHFVQSNPSLLQSTNCIISCVNGSLEHVSLSRYEMYKHEINHDMMPSHVAELQDKIPESRPANERCFPHANYEDGLSSA